MGRKKKVPEPEPEDDPFSEEYAYKYILETVRDVLVNMPMDKVLLCVLCTYAWWKAYSPNKNSRPTKEDVMLGIWYGLTIPPALQGGVVANGYATALLAYLGVGLAAPNIEGALDSVVSTMTGEPSLSSVIDTVNQEDGWAIFFTGLTDGLTDFYDSLKNKLPGLEPPPDLS